MWVHWAFKKPSTNLEQGDVLKRSPELVELLRTYHPHYAEHSDNRFYIVLTQSCDLVVRGGHCKARYIAIAPVRPLPAVVQREFHAQITMLDDGSGFAPQKVRNDLEKFLGRLINNNEPGYFYIEPEAGAGITEAMCAALALPISFRREHYEKFVSARVLALEDSFQAKLGWLLGQMYSRVGTRDFSEREVGGKVHDIASELAIWFDQGQFDQISSRINEERLADDSKKFGPDDLARIQQALPKRKEQAITAILDKAAELGLIPNPSPQRLKFRRGLESDAQFAQFFGR